MPWREKVLSSKYHYIRYCKLQRCYNSMCAYYRNTHSLSHYLFFFLHELSVCITELVWKKKLITVKSIGLSFFLKLLSLLCKTFALGNWDIRMMRSLLFHIITALGCRKLFVALTWQWINYRFRSLNRDHRKWKWHRLTVNFIQHLKRVTQAILT